MLELSLRQEHTRRKMGLIVRKHSLWFLVLATALLASSATAGNIVLNGGFTTGDLTNWTEHDCTSGCGVVGWFVTLFPTGPGAPSDTTLAATNACVGAGCSDPTTGDWISQTLSTVAAQTYTLSFFYRAGDNNGVNELDAFWNGSLVPGGSIVDPTPPYTWQHFTFSGLTATGGSTVLEFTGRQDPAALYLTDISVTANADTAPEPASSLLVGGGLLAMVAAVRRLRKA
jgi:hypothetical protein